MPQTVRERLSIRKYTHAVGAVIEGIDVARSQDDYAFAAIIQALDEHGVIFLRDQDLDTEQFKTFGSRFGALVERDWTAIGVLENQPAVQVLVKEPDQIRNIGDEWHSDQGYRAAPPRYTALLARQIPPFGGDTCYLSLSAAFDALPEAMKNMLRSLQVVHSRPFSMRTVMKQPDKDADSAHLRDEINVKPAVMRHPVTGREVLFISPAFSAYFEGWSEEQSAPLLNQLYRHLERPEFQCRFQWQVGSMALWDNRQVLHYAVNDYHGYRREMHRLIVT